MLDVRRLRLLRELAHRGTIAAVAEALAYTPSAVSQQLTALEWEAGTRLLARSGRRGGPTPAAHGLVAHAQDVRRLRLLRELAHRGTIAAVAEALAYTPSAVSQQLTALEREAGTRLLARSGRRVELTPAAHGLVAHAEAVLERLERAEADLAA